MLTFDIKDINNTAINAGKIINNIYKKNCYDTQTKKEGSPLTQADEEAHNYILKALTELTPNIPILSEENKTIIPYSIRKNWDLFWLVDPLDGTKEFIARNGQFTVNIALIKHTTPILGCIYSPIRKTLYFAKKNNGAYKSNEKGTTRICNTKKTNQKSLRVAVSNSHINEATKNYIKNLHENYEYIKMGSSLKFCLLAENKADLYPRLAPTMEWDTAAAHIILIESNRNIYEHESMQPLTYNKPSLVNPFFVAK